MAVSPLRVVEHLDVIEDIGPGLLPGGIDAAPDSLSFEQLEEALGHGVVVAVTAPTHAGLEFVGLQEVTPVVTAELTALVAVDDDLILGAPAPDGGKQGVEHQIAVDATAHGPTHHGAGEEIQHHGQIQPSLVRSGQLAMQKSQLCFQVLGLAQLRQCVDDKKNKYSRENITPVNVARHS